MSEEAWGCLFDCKQQLALAKIHHCFVWLLLEKGRETMTNLTCVLPGLRNGSRSRGGG